MTTTPGKFIAILIIGSALLLAGCNTLQRIENAEATQDFDDRFQAYSKNLRWSHYKQIIGFMTEGKAIQSLGKLKSLESRRVSEVKPIAWVLESKEDEPDVMVGDVVIDYYIVDRGTIRSTTQHQVWLYIDDTWRLDTALPDLP